MRWPGKRGPGTLYRRVQSLRFAATRDRAAIVRFIAGSRGAADRWRRLVLLARFERATHNLRGYHSLSEMLRITEAILARPGAVVVEAGCGGGSSTAKLSLAVREVGGELHVFDSFRGLPANDEVHRHLDGRPIRFRKGAFTGRLPAVRRAVDRYGAPEVCRFVRGWFADTVPGFDRPIDVLLCDVDLVASTRTCLVHLFPKLRGAGVAFSQDGHLEATVELVSSRAFWADEVGVAVPEIIGAGTDKLIEIRASAAADARFRARR